MIYLAAIYLFFSALRLLVLLTNAIWKPYLKSVTYMGTKTVSVLIPARNEEKTLQQLLPVLQQQSYLPIEIIVYDDDSTDATWHVIHKFAASNNRIKGVKGEPLPNGWLGKNHACYQLAKHAKGDYLLFLDADVIPENNLIENGLDYATRNELKLLSLFPQQKMITIDEKITVPLMHQILLSLLPLPLVRWSNKPSFAAANGQFMLFEAITYQKLQPHAWVKNHPVEDIRIIRLYKKFHLQVATLLGNGTIQCRMYQSYPEAINGFAKNLLSFFGNSMFFFSFYFLATSLGWITLFWTPIPVMISGFASIILMHSIRLKLSGQKTIDMIWIPLMQLSLLHIAFKAIRSKNSTKLTWKERILNHP